MKHPALFRTVAAVVVLAAPLAVGCGDDDDDGGTTPTVPVSTVSGGATTTPTTGTGGETSAADAAYVKSVCQAFNGAVSSATAAIADDPDAATDPAKFTDKLRPVIQTYVDDLGKAKPPADFAAGHKALVDHANDILTRLKNGQVKSLAEISDLASDTKVPKGTLDRIQAAAKAEPDCAAVGGEFFGQPG